MSLNLVRAAAPGGNLAEGAEQRPKRHSGKYLRASLNDLFDEQVEMHANNVALAFNGLQITYNDLNRGANQIAHLLQKLGVGRGQIVALLMDRCVETYVAILGILKAGAAYLPIDPAYPKERLAYILKQSRPHAVVTKSAFLHQAGTDPDAFVIVLDELKQFQKAKKKSGRVFDVQDVRQCSSASLPGISSAGDLAYVIFTSGSTGKPKGVMVEHGDVVDLIGWARYKFQITPQSRVAQIYSIAFDPSVQEIFTALLSGATLVPVSDEIRIDPPRFLSWLRESAISYWDTVPALWYRIVDHVNAQAGEEKLAFPHLETLVLGGDALHGDKVRIWMDRVEQGHRIYNVYGLTETTVSTTCFLVSADETRSLVPIGTPREGNNVYLLDERLEPCPPGAEGEICIGGAGVARGYLNAPELTAAAFVEGRLPGERLYRTGDFGRRLPDGNLEFLGRRDDQVKVRGYRVELTEIEAALRDHPRTEEVAVAVTEDEQAGHRKVVAFYVASAPVTPDEIRAHLTTKLPGFMVPHHFMRVGAFPLTLNGKIDKNALLQVLPEGGSRSIGQKPPTTTTELLLASIWKQVLGLDQVGADEDFFSLGGDSLLTVMVQRRCEQEGIRLASIDLFHHPTIGALARHIDGAVAEAGPRGPDRTAVALFPGRRSSLPRNAEQVLPLLGLQKKMLYESVQYGGASYRPQVVLHCEGSVDPAALEQAVNVLVSRHEALRTVFRTDVAAEPVQIILSELRCRVLYEDLSTLASDGASGASHPAAGRSQAFHPRKHQLWLQRAPDADDAGAPALPSPELGGPDDPVRRASEAVLEQGVDLSHGPSFSITVYKRSDARFDILWTSHHIVMDGWSTSLFYKELSVAYSSIVAKRFRPLPSLQSNFSDVVKHSLSKNVEPAREFWKQHLAGARFVELPRDTLHEASRARRPWRIESLAFALDEGMTQRLRRVAREHGVTLNTVCLAAYYVFLQQITRQDDVTAGVVTSGRSSGVAGTEHVVGNLIHLVPLRLNLTSRKTFGEIVRVVQSSLADVVAHEHLDLAEIAGLVAQEVEQEVAYDATTLPLETIFVSDNYPSPVELGAEPFQTFRVTGITAREFNGHPLTVVSSEEEGRLVFSFEYAVDLFTAETLGAWSRRFLDILQQIH